MKDATHISMVLDRSGSMESIRAETISSFNNFLKEQKAVDDECTFSLMQFDDRFEVVCNGVELKSVPDLTAESYVPRGFTALYDAIGKTVVETGEFLSRMKEEHRPSRILLCIVTDGHENASKEYKADAIKRMVQEQTDKYSWNFVFIGANQDAILTATSIGMSSSNAVNYAADAEGTKAMYGGYSRAVTKYRNDKEVKTSGFFTPDEDTSGKKK